MIVCTKERSSGFSFPPSRICDDNFAIMFVLIGVVSICNKIKFSFKFCQLIFIFFLPISYWLIAKSKQAAMITLRSNFVAFWNTEIQEFYAQKCQKLSFAFALLTIRSFHFRTPIRSIQSHFSMLANKVAFYVLKASGKRSAVLFVSRELLCSEQREKITSTLFCRRPKRKINDQHSALRRSFPTRLPL